LRGFTYLWLLFLIAMGAAGLAAIGERWSTAMQRDRERELVFRGREIARAIAAYRAASDAGPPRWPTGLADLVEDRRGTQPRRHLRRVYVDPFTDKSDWVPLLAEDGGWRGVHSRADLPAMLRIGVEAADRPMRLSARLFVADPATPAASAVLLTSAMPERSSHVGR
jgi:type II secretory pathway pseudopilin PulG